MTSQAAIDYEPLHRRPHTFLGVCEAVGEDFGFPPELLRVAFGVGLFFNPMIALGSYFGLGLLVALSRRLFPNPVAVENRRLRREADARAEAIAPAEIPANSQEEMALAA